jgi:hypothetical protein
MRVLTVRPPWSWAIAEAGKDVENRTWSTRYRGPLAIHAGRSVDRSAFARVEELAGRSVPRDVVGGFVVAVVDLVDVHAPSDCWQHGVGGCSSWAESGAFHWVLSNVRPLRSEGDDPGFGMQGSLGLRRLPADFEREILRRVS